MSFSWKPKWKKVVIKNHGIRITTAYDEVSGLYACPLCINIDELVKYGRVPDEKIPFFYSIRDLIFHIISHRKTH